MTELPHHKHYCELQERCGGCPTDGEHQVCDVVEEIHRDRLQAEAEESSNHFAECDCDDGFGEQPN